MYRNATPADRFWQKVRKSDGCWEWTARVSPEGYGEFWDDRNVRAHRFSWSLVNGPIPDGLMVCHRCDNPRCVRPDHLFLGTNRENIRDMMAKGRHSVMSVRASQTHCIRGHAFDAVNTNYKQDGRRQCKACKIIRNRRYTHTKGAVAT